MNARRILLGATGLDTDAPTLDRAVRARMRQLGLSRRADYVAMLCGSEVGELAELVVVPESWMFRDPVAFTCATGHVRERLARQPGQVPRILSAPCAGGEEPYSMAMALADAGIAPGACRIDAIDLSAAAIARARAGHYTRNAFRGGQMAFRDRYFTPDGDNYRLCDEIRAAVRFEQANLFALDGVCAAGYDVIFCRNLLIYFDDEGIRRAAAVLSQLLAEDGILLAGPAEVPALCAHGFTPAGVSGAFALRKGAGEVPPRARRAPYDLNHTGRYQHGVHARPAQPAPPAATPIRVRPQAAPMPAQLLDDAQRMADAGRLQEAATACRALLDATPEEPRAWFILGLVSQCQGDGAAAERHWRRCLYLQPDHYEALCALALLAEQGGERALAALYRQRAARAGSRTA